MVLNTPFTKLVTAVLGLVTQTLLVTVLTHALAALVLVDLGLTAFFEGTHDDMWIRCC